MTFAIDDEYITQTLIDLVRINSVNPSLSPNGKGEAEIGAYVANALNKLGLEVTTFELAPNRVNVIGILRGKGNSRGSNSLPPQSACPREGVGRGGRSLLLNAHMDTVGVDGMTIDSFGAEIENGRLYGRGSQDMKGSLAAMLGVAKAFAVSEQASIVKTVEQAIINRVGSKPAHTGQTFWTDAALLAEAGIETVLLGPIGQGLHSAEEWVDVQSVLDLATILVDTAVIYCH